MPAVVALLRSWPEAPASSARDEQAIVAPHARIGGEIGVAHQRADAQPALRRRLDLVEREAVHVDQVRRRLDLQLHQVEQVGAAGDELGAWVARGSRRGLGRRVRALVGEGLHALPPGDLGDRLDDVGVGAAAADVAAHALADLGGGHLRLRGQVGADMARDARLDLVEHRHGRADLPGRAVAALVAVVLDEGGLHRMQVAPACPAPRWW